MLTVDVKSELYQRSLHSVGTLSRLCTPRLFPMVTMTNTIDMTISLPQDLHEHLQRVARATGQSLPELLVQILRGCAPPDWSLAPAELQDELAALHSLDDEELAQIARSERSAGEVTRHEGLQEKNVDRSLTASEQAELAALEAAADRFAWRKSHAAALLRWRGLLPAPPSHEV